MDVSTECLDELFEIVRFERTEQAYNIWLDEKKDRSEEDRHNPNIVARGYADYVVIHDYPLRGRPVYLHMRKNKWWNKLTNEIFSYNQEMPNEDSTRLSAEFMSFHVKNYNCARPYSIMTTLKCIQFQLITLLRFILWSCHNTPDIEREKESW